jgi:hypothetical protein
MPMQYRDFDLDAFDYEENADGERFSVRVANSPAGQQRLSDAEQVPNLPNLRSQLRQLERRSLDLGEMIDLGEQLAQLLLPARVRWMLDRSRDRLDPGEGLRIRLRLDSYALSDCPGSICMSPDPTPRPTSEVRKDSWSSTGECRWCGTS